jgi:hypothetical protein
MQTIECWRARALQLCELGGRGTRPPGPYPRSHFTRRDRPGSWFQFPMAALRLEDSETQVRLRCSGNCYCCLS